MKLQRIIIKNLAPPAGKEKAEFYKIFCGDSTLQFSQYGRIYLNGNKGTFYKLYGTGWPHKDILANDIQKQFTKQYCNIVFFKGSAQYAPEMNFQYLFISDKKYMEDLS